VRCLRLLLLLTIPATASSQALFESNELLEAELAGPLAALVNSGEDRPEFPFVITVAGVAVPVDVRLRGNSRLRVCSFPPLRLNFSAKTAAGTLFEGQDKLKLVTHCSEKPKDAGNTLEEYLTYRLFNLLSDDSYRVRPLRIRYTDTDSGGRPGAAHDAFLIESDKAFARRQGVSVLDAPGVYLSRLDERQAARMYVFQYLVGDTDWSLVTADTKDHCCHNVDLFEREGRTVVVPYDFDLAGLVDASYAKPDASLRLRSVKTRRYRGYCLSPDVLAAALDAVVDLRGPVMETAAAVPAANPERMRIRLDYLGEFFSKAADREGILREFSKRCLD
jgi:hypothetical protein